MSPRCNKKVYRPEEENIALLNENDFWLIKIRGHVHSSLSIFWNGTYVRMSPGQTFYHEAYQLSLI